MKKSIFSDLVKRLRDYDLSFQAKSEKRKDKRAQKWRETKIKLKKIPFVAFLVTKRNQLRRKIKNSKFYQAYSAKMDKILTPEIRKKLWDIKRSFAYRFIPRVALICAACFVALLILNGNNPASTSSASQMKEKKQATTKKVEATEEPEVTKEPEATKEPEVTEEPQGDPNYEPFVPTEDNTKWLEGANKNVFDDKNYKDVKGYKFYFNNKKVASYLGIDVSAHQGVIDWQKVAKTGVKFAMIRVGVRGHKTGKIQLDKYFKYNIENAQKYGLKVGVYFFTQAINTKEALEEANFVLNCLKGYKLDMPVVFDMEYVGYKTSRTKLANMNNELRTDIAIAFMEHVKKAGYVPMFYANKNWLEQAIQLSRLNDYFIWFARYNNVPDYEYRYHMWQYTETGKISGIEGNVDLNVCLINFDKYTNKRNTVTKGTTNNTNTTNKGQTNTEVKVEPQVDAGNATNQNNIINQTNSTTDEVKDVVTPQPETGGENTDDTTVSGSTSTENVTDSTTQNTESEGINQ